MLMSSSIYTVTVDCADPRRLAGFWSALLDYQVTFEEDDEVAIERSDETGPALLFARSPDTKRVKNRIHFDLNPDDQDAEVRRAKELGAVDVDIGQKDVSWVVLADPEGNEFCILTPRED
jgi:predicted enzyme related to lactoylglutathione lyase